MFYRERTAVRGLLHEARAVGALPIKPKTLGQMSLAAADVGDPSVVGRLRDRVADMRAPPPLSGFRVLPERLTTVIWKGREVDMISKTRT